MQFVLSFVIGPLLLVRAEWISERIGGSAGERQDLICSPDSWIDQVKGGIAYQWNGRVDSVSQFEARCTNGETLAAVCGSTDGMEVETILNANGFDSVSGTAVGNYVRDLSFYLNGDLLGSFSDSEMQQTLACPENEVIMGLAVRCGQIVDAIELWCGSPEGYPTENPTPTPSYMLTSNPTEMPTNPPSPMPTKTPTQTPTNSPTQNPTQPPTAIPTVIPTGIPTNPPSPMPTKTPTQTPTNSPTQNPIQPPTAIPTVIPTGIPTTLPTEMPTLDPTLMPTYNSSETPTTRPTDMPTWMPTILPTLHPRSSCSETVEKLEIVIDYLMDYLYCMKHASNPDDCSGTYNEIPI